MIFVSKKRILLIITERGKKYLVLTALVVFTAILVNAIIFARLSENPIEEYNVPFNITNDITVVEK